MYEKGAISRMKAPPRPCRFLALAVPLFLFLTARAEAQFIYLDMNGDGISTGTDVLNPTGTPTACDIWLITNQNPDGSTAVCNSGCPNLTINSYEFILRASGGGVAWGSLTGVSPFSGTQFTRSNATDFYARWLGPNPNPAGAYKLATLQVTATSGSPTLAFVTSTPLAGHYLTAFGTQCHGLDEDNTYKMGSDWGFTGPMWTITGTVFYDNSGTSSYGCIPDPGESGLQGLTVQLSPGSLSATTDANGNFTICGAVTGSYSLRLLPTPLYSQSCPPSNLPQPLNLVAGQTYSSVNFGVQFTMATIMGRVFSDLNGTSVSDCLPDAGEFGLKGWHVTIDPGAKGVITNLSGDYTLKGISPGDYSLTVTPAWGYTASQSCPSGGVSQSVSVGAGNTYTDVDFGEGSILAHPDLELAIGASNAVPGNYKYYQLPVTNHGAAATNATLTFVLPPQVTYVASSNPVGTYSAGTVTFNIGTIAPLQSTVPKVQVQVPASVPLGTQLSSSGQVSCSEPESHLSDNVDSETEIVRGSFDPNAKAVWPPDSIASPQVLRYHIDFQNVGTGPASKVEIQDLLDTNLDLATLVPKAMSHEGVFSVTGRQLLWTFDGINLPDATTDEPGSHGWVEFTVAPMPGSASGTVVQNNATIFFDYNAPITTNTVVTILDSRPVFSRIPDRTLVEGRVLDQPISLTDAESDDLTFSLAAGPSWASVSKTGPQTGNLHLAPQSGDAGNETIRVSVSDGLLSAQDTCMVNVLTPTGVELTESFPTGVIHLGSNLPATCFDLRPQSNSFAPSDIDGSTVTLAAPGHGAGRPIQARAGSQRVAGTGDVCFTNADLRSLLADVSGTARVTLSCEGTLTNGKHFYGLLPVEVHTGIGRLAVSVAPNPLNPSGLMTFRTKSAGFIRVAMFDLKGRRVRTLMNNPVAPPGYVEIPFNGRNDAGQALASGVYFYRIDTAEGSYVGRVTVLK
jgi:uncharacterized repeat protein (TIGR01451 family)